VATIVELAAPETRIPNSTSAPTAGIGNRCRFRLPPRRRRNWVAVRRTVPGTSALGGTSGAALREATSVVLRVMAELAAKGDRVWAQFKEAGP